MKRQRRYATGSTAAVGIRHEIGDTPFSFERANDGFPPTRPVVGAAVDVGLGARPWKNAFAEYASDQIADIGKFPRASLINGLCFP
jgi:hypothetical protein